MQFVFSKEKTEGTGWVVEQTYVLRCIIFCHLASSLVQ